MNYTVLPKNINFPRILITNKCKETEDLKIEPFISHSVYYYYEDIIRQFLQIKKNEITVNKEHLEEVEKIINQYEFLFTKVPNSNYSVSKMKPSNYVFYTYMELIYSNNILENFKNKNMNCIFFSSYADVFTECMTISREDYNDKYSCLPSISFENKNDKQMEINNSFDLLYIELDEKKNQECFQECLKYSKEYYKNYFLNCIYALYKTITYQKYQGITILKLDVLIHKPILEIVYLYTCLFEKVIVVKPNSSKMISNKRYLICKNYQFDSPNYDLLNKINFLLMKRRLQNLLFDFDLPYYFLNKIEESNLCIGYQQIEQVDLIINIIKNKNREEKLENIKKTNIQKCILWCEKHNIPHNKFIEKGNIFLPANQIPTNQKKDVNDLTGTRKNKENISLVECEFEKETKNDLDLSDKEDYCDKEDYENNTLHENLFSSESTMELEFYANTILEEQINMGIDEYLYEPSLYI